MAPARRDLRVLSGGRASDGGGRDETARASSSPSDGEPTKGMLRDLYHRYGGCVYGRCYYLLKERTKAEDAMQDVFAKALGNLTGFRGEASPLTWLTTIATNHCLNLLRSERAPWRQAFEDEETARVGRAMQDGPSSGPRLFENREAVRRILARVDRETQAAAIHYYVDEMTLDEVAATLGRSVPTVRKRLEAFAAMSGAALSPGAEATHD